MKYTSSLPHLTELKRLSQDIETSDTQKLGEVADVLFDAVLEAQATKAVLGQMITQIKSGKKVHAILQKMGQEMLEHETYLKQTEQRVQQRGNELTTGGNQ